MVAGCCLLVEFVPASLPVSLPPRGRRTAGSFAVRIIPPTYNHEGDDEEHRSEHKRAGAVNPARPRVCLASSVLPDDVEDYQLVVCRSDSSRKSRGRADLVKPWCQFQSYTKLSRDLSRLKKAHPSHTGHVGRSCFFRLRLFAPPEPSPIRTCETERILLRQALKIRQTLRLVSRD